MYADPGGTPFRSVSDLSPQAIADDDNHINAIGAGADGAIWLGTGSSGLRRYDPGTDTFQDFGAALQSVVSPPPPATASAPGASAQAAGATGRNDNAAASAGAPGVFVFGFVDSTQGGLLLATTGGLLHLDPATAGIKRIVFADPELNAQLDEGVRTMLRARNGDLWLAPLRAGLLQAQVKQFLAHVAAVDQQFLEGLFVEFFALGLLHRRSA